MSEQAPNLPKVIEGTVVERLVNARRQPVVPAWIRDDVTRRAAAKYAVLHTVHLAAFHTARTPKYAGRTALHAPRGAVRLVLAAGAWVLDFEAHPLRAHAVEQKDPATYIKLAKIQHERAVHRGTVVGIVVGLTAIGIGVTDWLVWPDLWAPVAAAGVAFLGYLGRPLGRPFLDTATVLPRSERLTQDIVTRALGALGIAGINQALGKDGRGISYVSVPHRDGPGWRVDVDLPFGVTAVDIIERRDKLASGLRRPQGCVWPEPSHDVHAGRLVLHVTDEDMARAKQAAWPLAKAGQADLFRPVSFGTDQRARDISVTLMFASVLIGAMPRMGKTFALRVLALAAALDPTAEIRCFELKGTGDLECMEHVAHHYGSGVDDATIEACLASLHQVHRDLERRAAAIKALPKDLRPENKVTPELARRRSLRLHPVVFIIDEAQEAYTSAHADAFDELTTAIVKRGPALGVILLLATQRPDAKSLPTGISANIGIRFCLRVMGQVENDMVLGTSSYKKGLRATEFTSKDKGIGYLAGHADDPQLVRSYYTDALTADAIGRRARALREAAGTLSGHAIGEQDQAPASVSLLADVASVTAGEDKVWSETICGRLAELRPELYRGWDATQLANALNGYGVSTGQVWSEGANRRGVARADVLAALGRGNGHAER